MVTRKYSDACGIARSLDVIGERWALLVVRELVYGPKRFTDLRAGLRGISQNVLSQRLRELEAADIVRRVTLGPPASTQAYELTARGRALKPILVGMSRWGALTPVEPGAEMSNDAFALALEALHVGDAARGRAAFRGRIRLELVRDAFDAEVGDDGLRIARASGAAPDLVVAGSESALRDVMFGRRTLAAAISAGDVRVDGDRRAAERFLAGFALPELPAETPAA